MRAGLLVADLLFLLLLSLSGSAATWAGLWAHRALLALTPAPLALVGAAAAGVIAYVGTVCLVALLLPRPRPGSHEVLRSGPFFAWLLHVMVRRALDVPPVSTLTMQLNTLRWLTLRCLGAKVDFTASMSSDVTLLDPWLLEAGPNVVVGSRALLAGHYIRKGRLILGRIVLGPNVEVGGDAVLGPGVRIGEGGKLGYGVKLFPDTEVLAGARIPALSVLEPDAPREEERRADGAA